MEENVWLVFGASVCRRQFSALAPKATANEEERVRQAFLGMQEVVQLRCGHVPETLLTLL